MEIVRVNAPYRPHWAGSLRGARALFRLIPYLLKLWAAGGRVQLFHVMANSGWSWHLWAAPAIWIAKLRRVAVVVNYRGGQAQEFFERHGARAVLVARLIPFINPDVISYAAGLTRLGWRTFLLAIAIGSVPSTLVYSYLGARGVTSLGWLLIPLVGLGLLALAGAIITARRPAARPDAASEPVGQTGREARAPHLLVRQGHGQEDTGVAE